MSTAPSSHAHESRWWPLLRLVLLLVLAGAALDATAGPPGLPSELVRAQFGLSTLAGTSVPLEALGYALNMAAWLIWAWLLLSLGIRLALASAELATHGAEWVHTLRRASDRFTLPLVRRAVDSALAVAVVVQVVAHTPTASAAPLNTDVTSVTTVGSVAPPSAATVEAPAPGARAIDYTVQPGDTLWSIAEHFYGTGHEYQRLLEANVERPMRDGQVFPPTGVIEPGWVLRVPLANTRLEQHDGQAWYSVERGDTLWGISARFLGDPMRWPELFDANQGATLADGRMLTNPNLIWPEMRLKVPVELEPAPEAELAPAIAPAVDGGPAMTTAQTQSPSAAIELPQAAFQPNGALAAGGASAMAGVSAVAALLAVRRRGRRALDEPPLADEPESDVLVRGGFAELDDLLRPAPEPIDVAAAEILRFLDERGLAGRVGLVSARHGRSSSTLVLVSQQLADRPKLLELAAPLSARLGIQVRAQLSRDHDVALRLVGLKRARFAEASGMGATARVRLLPLGLLPDRRLLYVNWPAMGPLLVVGRSAAATLTVLGAVVAALAARSRPEDLRFVTIARPGSLPSALARLPHQTSNPIDPDDRIGTTAALHEVRAELLRRMERVERGGAASVSGLPELTVVISELDGLPSEHASTVEMLGAYGAAHRVRLIAATSRPAAVADAVLAHFATRAVLRLSDEAQSQRLLGQTSATDLLGGGQLLLQLDGREPIEAYAFRAPELAVEQLARALRGDTTPVVRRPTLLAEALPASVETDVMSEPDLDDEMDEDTISAEDRREPIADARGLGQHEPPPMRAPIQVRCFGGFDVQFGEHDLTRANSPAEAAERAGAWEVLAYLAVHPEGVVGRDDLINAVWPGIEPRRALDALEATLRQLNALLAPAGPRGRAETGVARLDDRDGTCRLDLLQVDSDVHRFVRLCRAAPLMPAEQAVQAWERAHDLMRGDLLDGPGARAYAWADAPSEDGELSLREQYREQGYRVSLRLARSLARRGRHAEAIPLLRALLDAEPLLEDVVRDLYRCHAALGDMTGLVHEEQRLRAALRQAAAPYGGSDDDGPEPEPATIALFKELREDLEVRGAVPA